MKIPFLSLLKIIVEGKSSHRLLIGAIASFAFSISVILSAVGLMDGFEASLVNSLRKSTGDISVRSVRGFFVESSFKAKDGKLKEFQTSSLITTQSFSVSDSQSKGVLVHGVDPKSFNKITGLNIPVIGDGEIVIGKELADFFSLAKGDEISLFFSTNKSKDQGIPISQSFTILQVIEHKIYEKDLRFVYLNRSELSSILGYRSNVVNKIILKKKKVNNSEIERVVSKLNSSKGTNFRYKAYWEDYKVLIDAVKVEKFSIATILQLIVIVSIFNILAFIIFVLERQSQSFFLLRALGISQKVIIRFWAIVLVLIWLSSCLLATVFSKLFDFLLQNLSLFQLPGDIYVLSKLQLDLEYLDYLLVFGISFFWILCIGSFAIYRLKNKTILFGLRQEFS